MKFLLILVSLISLAFSQAYSQELQARFQDWSVFKTERGDKVVCYIASPVSYAIAKRLIKIKFISLVNLIFDREVVRELIQHECNVQLLQSELESILIGGSKRQQQELDCEELVRMLGNGSASDKVASYICS